MIFTFKFVPNYDHYETKKIKFFTLFIIRSLEIVYYYLIDANGVKTYMILHSALKNLNSIQNDNFIMSLLH
jgi:hypothetical protein